MPQNTAQRFILVDGSSFLFRAYHAVPTLTSPQGLPTNAIHGVTNMLRKLLADYQGDHIAVVFDAPGKTFRNDLYADYKAHRPPMPEDLRVQIEPLHTIIRAMGLPLIIESGIEADDVLGVLAYRAAEQGHPVIISTGDKDMAQLVNPQIILENTMTNTRMDEQGVFDKFAVRPDQIVDYLALIGDSVDNIPGVPKVGPKTAAKWLAEYQTLANLIAHADDIKGKIGENLRNSLAQLPLAKQLATIRCDLPLPYQLDDLKQQPFDKAELKSLLAELGFNTWLKMLDNTPSTHVIRPDAAPQLASATVPETPACNYQIILTMAQFNGWLAKLEQASLFAFDTETTSLDYSKAQIVGVSFAVEAGTAAYLPLAHDYPGVPNQLDRTTILAKLRPLLENPLNAKVGQNLKYDSHVLANHGITLCGIAHDTLLASYIVNSTGRHNMDDLAKKYLGLDTIRYEAVAGKGAKQIGFAEVSIEQATPYAAEDADITLRLHHVLQGQLQHQPRLLQLYTDLEMPLLSVLVRIERNGVLIDTDMLTEQSNQLASQLMSIEQHAHQLAGRVFNLGSPKQIQEILYDELKLPVLKKTPKGQPSTDESVLQELAADDYPLPKIILEHRSLSKLKSTYIDKLPQQVDSQTGRVHTSYHQAVAATGRLSSSDPNLQNIPIRSEEGRKIRQAFIAPSGYKLLAADYSQIELRIMAHLSADAGLLQAFSQGEDIHRATAAEVFGVAPEQVTNDLRRSAKAINFGLIYGMSAFGLAQQLGLSRNQAQAYIDLYFARYPGVKAYMDSIREQAKAQGYVETLLGRRLYLPDINARNAAVRQYAERTAINAPMQGTAADIIKRAMISADAWLLQEQPDAKMLMQVHDELVFEVAEGQVEYCTAKIREIMCSAAQLDVPLVVDIGVGNNWDEAH